MSINGAREAALRGGVPVVRSDTCNAGLFFGEEGGGSGADAGPSVLVEDESVVADHTGEFGWVPDSW
jgi:hypothetical protein